MSKEFNTIKEIADDIGLDLMEVIQSSLTELDKANIEPEIGISAVMSAILTTMINVGAAQYMTAQTAEDYGEACRYAVDDVRGMLDYIEGTL